MRRRALALATLASGIAAASFAGSALAHDEPPTPDWDMVAFEVKSWGSPSSAWRILSNGGGSWTEAVAQDGQAYNSPPSLAWHEIEPDAGNYASLEAILRRLPNPAPDSQACDNFMTDMAYGTLRLTRGATTTEVAWNSGCLDDDYVAFMDILREADEHMRALGKAAPVSRIEPPVNG